jgi:hypothetical protein
MPTICVLVLKGVGHSPTLDFITEGRQIAILFEINGITTLIGLRGNLLENTVFDQQTALDRTPAMTIIGVEFDLHFLLLVAMPVL